MIKVSRELDPKNWGMRWKYEKDGKVASLDYEAIQDRAAVVGQHRAEREILDLLCEELDCAAHELVEAQMEFNTKMQNEDF